MNTIFINSENSKTSINLKKVINIFFYQVLTFNIHGEIWKSDTRIINLKYQLQRGMKNLNTGWILFCIKYSKILNISVYH